MRGPIAVVLALTLSLAGCFGGTDGDDVDGDGMEQAPVDSDSGNVTNSPPVDSDSGNVTNSPPVVEFAANRTEGAAPLDVRFDFNASDPDGGNLTWTLDVDGDGISDSEGAVLPFNFTFTFSTPGTFNATLNVTDGINATVEAITIVVEDAEDEGEGGEAGEAGPSFPVELTGTLDESNADFYLGEQAGPWLFCSGWAPTSTVTGGECAWHEIEADWVGHDYTTQGDGDIDVSFASACSATAVPTGAGGADGHDSGTIPDDTGCIIVADYNGSGPYKVTIK